MAGSTPSFYLVAESVQISTAEDVKPGSLIDISVSESADESTVEMAKILCDHYEFLNLEKKRKRSKFGWLMKEISITQFVVFCAAGFVLGVVGKALRKG